MTDCQPWQLLHVKQVMTRRTHFNNAAQLPLRKVAGVLLWLWALPLTLCGMCLWVGVRLEQLIFKSKHAKAYVITAQPATVLIAHSPSLHWLLQHHPFGPMDAMAIGCCVVARDAATLQGTLAHELVHVQQALHWGPLFPLAYAACSAWAFATGGCAYADNAFERQAQRADTCARMHTP